MANPNPDTSGLRPAFAPGQSGNPGGKTSAQRKLEIANAERATRIRAAMLAKIEAMIDPETGEFDADLSADLNTFLRDSENRGLGAPKQTNEHTGPDGGPVQITRVALEFVRPDPKTADG